MLFIYHLLFLDVSYVYCFFGNQENHVAIFISTQHHHNKTQDPIHILILNVHVWTDKVTITYI